MRADPTHITNHTMYEHNKEVAKKHDVDAESSFIIVDPIFYANSSVDIECRCSSCGRVLPGARPDTACSVCGGRLVPERIGSLDVIGVSGLDGLAVRVVLPRDEAPKLLSRLDRALRQGFGLRLCALDECAEAVAREIGSCDEEASGPRSAGNPRHTSRSRR